MTPDVLDGLRRQWISEVARGALPEKSLMRFPVLASLEPITQCTLILGVGAGHLLGVDVADLTFDGVLTTEEVIRLVNAGWRRGDVNPDLAAWLLPSILSMLWAARRYEGWDESATGLWFADSHLERRISEAWGEGWASVRDFESRITMLCADAPADLSMDELYLWLYRAALDTSWFMSLTPLEARLLGEDPGRDAACERLERARTDHYLWLLVPGAWPERPGDATPDWLRDTVATEGARFWRASAGYVATLTVIVETDRDERSLRRWCYEPTIGLSFPTDSSVEMFIVLDVDTDPAYLPFYFAYDDYRTAQQLDVILEVGLVRVEFYRLNEDGTLNHLWNFGVRTTGLDDLRAHRAKWGGEMRDHFNLIPSPTELLAMIDQRQRALFESTVPLVDVRATEPSVVDAWEHRLEVLEDAARSYAFGGLIDEKLLSESVDELRLAEASVRRTVRYPEPESVRVGEALLHISIKEDSGWFSAAVVYRGRCGDLEGHLLDLDAPVFEKAFSPAELIDALVELFAPLHVLVERGVTDLLISAGLGTYGLPIHEAALRLGFQTATYSHSLRLLHPLPASIGDDVCAVLGYAGSGSDHIGAAEAELNIVRTITGGEAINDWRARWPRVLHVAGHGVAGVREHEAGIRLEHDFLSAPGVLRSVDARGTRLAFLSACDSGAGVFRPGQVARSVPLDVALLEKGCHSVVSTSAPVNDHVALIFAATFHHHFAAGLTAWESYREARSVFASERPDVPGEVANLLDDSFPEWRVPLSARAMMTWQFFRFSGDRESRSPKPRL
ncbi:MAG TPA: CHAT domain-containing protein [Friedmanniella sp.]